MSDLLQTGGFSRAQTATTPQQTVRNPPAWRYLWLLADAGNQAAVNVWTGTPPNNRAPDVVLGPGQQREQDLGALGTWNVWIASADGSAWAAQYAMDVEAIGIDANVVGATTPLQPARSVGTFQTNNNVQQLAGPYPVQADQQGVIVQYPLGSSGPTDLRIQGNDGSVSATEIPNIGFASNTFVFLFPDGMGATTYQVRHTDSDIAPQTVKVGAFFTPLQQLVVAQQGFGFGVQNAWDMRVAGAVPGSGALPVTPQVPGLTWSTFSRLTAASTTIIAGAVGKTISVWAYRISLRPPVAGVNDGTVTLASHVTAVKVDVIEYNQDSAAALGSQHTGVALPAPLALPAGEGLDVNIFTDAGGLSVSGMVAVTQA